MIERKFIAISEENLSEYMFFFINITFTGILSLIFDEKLSIWQV